MARRPDMRRRDELEDEIVLGEDYDTYYGGGGYAEAAKRRPDEGLKFGPGPHGETELEQLDNTYVRPTAERVSAGGSASGGVKAPAFSYGSAPEYINRRQEQIDNALNVLMNRQAFSYDPETDPAYQAMRKSYTRSGQRAMQDTLGQISARTGGLASSYAGSAAQQAYDRHMEKLDDNIPELRQLAYSMYKDEEARDRQNLDLLMALERGDYDKYRDVLGQYNNDRSFDYGTYRDRLGDDRWSQEWQYQKERDAAADQRYEDEWAYKLARDKIEDQRYEQSRRSGGGRSSGSGRPSGSGKPRLTAAQTLAALKSGAVNDSTLAAYEYWYGQPWDEGEPMDRTSLDFDEDEGIFRWDGREYGAVEDLLYDMDEAGLSEEETEKLKKKFKMYGFELS